MTTASLIDPAWLAQGLEETLPGGLRLRALADGDVDPLVSAMAGTEPWEGLGYTVSGLARYWRRPDAGAARIGLYSGDRLCGALCVRHRWLCGAFLELLCLLPAVQGQGRGRQLLQWLVREARPMGPNLWTSVAARNQRARSFYRAAGFVQAAVISDLIVPGEDEVLLRRSLLDVPLPATSQGR